MKAKELLAFLSNDNVSNVGMSRTDDDEKCIVFTVEDKTDCSDLPVVYDGYPVVVKERNGFFSE